MNGLKSFKPINLLETMTVNIVFTFAYKLLGNAYFKTFFSNSTFTFRTLVVNTPWQNIVYSPTARRQNWILLCICTFARIFDVLLSQMKNVNLVINKPFWPQVTAFWWATQLGRKFVFWQLIIAICRATTRKMYFKFIFVLCFSFSFHDMQSAIYSPRAAMLNT